IDELFLAVFEIYSEADVSLFHHTFSRTRKPFHWSRVALVEGDDLVNRYIPQDLSAASGPDDLQRIDLAGWDISKAEVLNIFDRRFISSYSLVLGEVLFSSRVDADLRAVCLHIPF